MMEIQDEEHLNIELFQEKLTLAVHSITAQGLEIVKTDSGKILQNIELPFTAYIPEITRKIQTTEFFDAIETGEKVFETINRSRNRTSRKKFLNSVEEMTREEGWRSVIDGHAKRTAELGKKIGIEIGYSAEEAEEMYWGVLVHDIGKVFVNELERTMKHRGVDLRIRLAFIRTHATLGWELLKSVNPLFVQGEDCAIEHQENIDGTGYPNGLKYEVLSEAGRIANLVDGYDALRTRVGWKRQQIIDHVVEIYTKAGYEDDKILKGFLRVLKKNRAGMDGT